MHYKKTVLILTVLFSSTVTWANDFIKKAFVTAPFEVVPTLSQNSRLDMIDYFEHGLAHPSLTYFGDDVVITALDSYTISALTSKACSITMAALPTKQDTLTVVINSYDIPVPDSRVTIYTRDWKPIASIDAGLIKDWFTTKNVDVNRQEDIVNALEFITASATFNPASEIFTFTNTSGQRIGTAEYSKIQPYLKTERKFKFNGKVFKEIER